VLTRGVANIPEVMKTRLQLQGELIKTSDAQKVYKNVFDVFRKTWANEGLRGLQRGLGPAVSECEKRGGVMFANVSTLRCCLALQSVSQNSTPTK
jgi:solute carrier family 25 protein 34/35